MADKLPPTLVILNPKAGSGQAGRRWPELEPLLKAELGELKVVITQHPDEVIAQLVAAESEGIRQVIALGGDGTNHFMLNTFQEFATSNPTAPPFTYGQIPLGTGRDFCRTLGTPFDPPSAIRWLGQAKPRQIDIGHLEIDNTHSHYFLNISSAGISGDISYRVNSIQRRRFWTFHVQSLAALLTYKPRHLKVTLDGEVWYDDKTWIVAVANGQAFGNGMLVAPQASIIDGQFEVVIVENSPRLELMVALNSLYTAKHLDRADVHAKQASEVIIETQNETLNLEMDGETYAGRTLKYTVKSGTLSMLTHELEA